MNDNQFALLPLTQEHRMNCSHRFFAPIIRLLLQVNVTAVILNQTEFCQALYSDYQHKKKKKKFGETASVEPFEVTRADAGDDSILHC